MFSVALMMAATSEISNTLGKLNGFCGRTNLLITIFLSTTNPLARQNAGRSCRLSVVGWVCLQNFLMIGILIYNDILTP